MRHSHKNAFTLIELLIVILIVAILASVAVPIMRMNTKKAIATEAMAFLSAMAKAIELYEFEHPGTLASPGRSDLSLDQLDFGPVSLEGVYFTEECFTLGPITPNVTFYLICNPADSTAVKADVVRNWKKIYLGFYGSLENGERSYRYFSEEEGLGMESVGSRFN